MSIPRKSWALGAAGLVAGVALGVTGFANAADPSPSPSPGNGQDLGQRFPDRHGGPFGGRFKDHVRGGYGGLVTAIDSDSLTVRSPRGTETISLTSSTTYYVGKTKAARSAVEKGTVVHVRLVDPRATKKVAAVVTVLPAHLEGWVTKIGDSSITLTDPSGFTRTIRTGPATTYVKDGAAATRTAITVGSLVRAIGQVDSDGTTLDATRVAVGRPAKEDRAGPGGAGFDGPMQDGPMDAPAGYPAA
jgi:hypothetical protein